MIFFFNPESEYIHLCRKNRERNIIFISVAHISKYVLNDGAHLPMAKGLSLCSMRLKVLQSVEPRYPMLI